MIHLLQESSLQFSNDEVGKEDSCSFQKRLSDLKHACL
jgi:hypothetical protein